MSQQAANLAILFADINGSTELYDKLGNVQARAIIAKCIELMTAEVTAHQGTVIKTIGDEIMCTFPSAEAAMNAAMRMQLVFELRQPGGNYPIFIHSGFHFGPVICESGDVYGDAVNVAALITRMTRAREIMTTEATAQLLPAESRRKVRQILRAGLKGKEGEINIYRVVWDQDDTLYTRVGRPAERPGIPSGELVLHYRGYTYRIDEQHRTLLLGRDQHCDVVVPSLLASRQHARVEFRSGKYVLADFSANGTYLRFRDGQIIRLAHEETVLHASGSISLGQPFSEGPVELVEFSVS